MLQYKYDVATTLNHAWLNFELDLPLHPKADGTRNPFYVERPGNPVAILTDDDQHERLQILALLEYRNAKNWCDVHPGLTQLLDEVS
ncbi:hypothetical protein QUF64_11615 [Anaerolineales bacterium HSG6]|nr:hypothetical protein [Anaerolineales bacterium HSG6]MDM8531801.1 hypothetical protein [Anaerolineales bacterium HSG25]